MRRLSEHTWTGSCTSTESTLHQLAPYIGKLKSTIAAALVDRLSKPGDVIVDPFVGSGTVALEAVSRGRGVVCADVSPYAVLLTKAKLAPPRSLEHASQKFERYIKLMEHEIERFAFPAIPSWVRQFFHERTLKEALYLSLKFQKHEEHFLQACLLGILHHQRPGFLSYPSSHLVPYLRDKQFPRDRFPDLYQYRPVAPRLLAKLKRAFRRPIYLPPGITRRCALRDLRNWRAREGTADAVITSPPYMNALDYVRDNRLRLWFMNNGESTKALESTRSPQQFADLMADAADLCVRLLKPTGRVALVVGEANRSENRFNTIQFTRDLFSSHSALREVSIIEDVIPDIRRARRDCKGTKRECVLIYRKVR